MPRPSLVASLLAAALLGACATAGAGKGAAHAGSTLPDFELATVDGDSIRLSDLVGKDVVVLAFWDTWCDPCKAELPTLDRLYRTHGKEGLKVLAIAMDDPSTVAQVAPYVHQQGFSFPVLLDPDGDASGLYDVHKTAPHTVVIGRDGRIARQESGFEPGADKLLETFVTGLLAAPKR